MGFLEGLVQTGKYYNLQDQAGELADIVNYLELPLDIPGEDTDPEKRPQAIRVALKVADPDAVPLDVQGIESITLADYPGNPRLNPKTAYLYKSPVGSNVSWGFSPVYKLGRGISDQETSVTALIGDRETNWLEAKQSRYFKMHKRVLNDYEESSFFTKGSVMRLMNSLVDNVNEISRYWCDRKRSYLLVFGLNRDNQFVFPGEIPAFIEYFRAKIADRQNNSQSERGLDCILCHKDGAAGRTLDQVFKFSTFDKPGFLPGGDIKNSFSVFPICENCYSLLQRGYFEAQTHFSSRIGISTLDVLIIPEMIGELNNLDRLQKTFEDFIVSGVQKEIGFYTNIAKRGASYVFHFLFTEKIQAQVRLHRMVEDVPPSHFRKLFTLWNWNKKRFFPERDDTQNLDSAIRQIVMMLQSLAGKTDGEKEVMKTQVINLVADLFANAYIDVETLKRMAVSRVPGMVSDPDWLNAKRYSGGYQLERLWMLFEFLYAYNRYLDQEEVNM